MNKKTVGERGDKLRNRGEKVVLTCYNTLTTALQDLAQLGARKGREEG